MIHLNHNKGCLDKISIDYSISCVIVFFEPNDDAIVTVINLTSKNYNVIAVLNKVSESFKSKLESIKNLHIIENKENLGLASGLNQGAAYAFDVLQSKYTIFFDQDSTPDTSLPEMLRREFESVSYEKVACISPILIDKKSRNFQSINESFKYHKSITVPTSGTLLPISSWNKFGPMLDGLFIDCIDHEWCFRALHQGYKIRVSTNVKMFHNMGDIGIHLLGVYKPIYSSPTRHYYIIRNTLLLFSYAHVSKKWLFIEILKIIPRCIFYLYFSRDRVKSLKLILRAIKDGVSNKMGRCLE